MGAISADVASRDRAQEKGLTSRSLVGLFGRAVRGDLTVMKSGEGGVSWRVEELSY